MKLDRPVATHPPKPLVIFDGDCRFCVRWIRRWQKATGEQVAYAPFQDTRVVKQFPELRHESLAAAVHLIETDGAVYFGAEAALRALAHNPGKGRLLRWYHRSRVFANLAELVYRFVARRRRLFSWFVD